jgi:hypothetical protein
MTLRATAHGLRAASRNKRLVVTLWLFNLALALAAGVPGWRALQDAIGSLPAADPLAEAFSFGVLVDLTELRPGLVTGLGDAAAAVFALGLLVGLVATGGSLEVLMSGDDRSFAHRFGRGAFRFFGRFLRLAAISAVAAVLLAGVVAGPLVALGRHLRRESGSEALALSVLLAALLACGLMVLLTLLVQDAARVRIVREDPRRVLPALWAGVGLVLRHPAKWLGTWALNAALLLVVFAAYVALANRLPTPELLAVLIVLQQLFVLVRCGLRVALLDAEVTLVAALQPPVPPAQPAAPPPPAPAAPAPPEPA